jgi:hypothetical protein
LVLFVRIGTFQWVTSKKIRKIDSRLKLCAKRLKGLSLSLGAIGSHSREVHGPLRNYKIHVLQASEFINHSLSTGIESRRLDSIPRFLPVKGIAAVGSDARDAFRSAASEADEPQPHQPGKHHNASQRHRRRPRAPSTCNADNVQEDSDSAVTVARAIMLSAWGPGSSFATSQASSERSSVDCDEAMGRPRSEPERREVVVGGNQARRKGRASAKVARVAPGVDRCPTLQTARIVQE